MLCARAGRLNTGSVSVTCVSQLQTVAKIHHSYESQKKIVGKRGLLGVLEQLGEFCELLDNSRTYSKTFALLHSGRQCLILTTE